MVPFLQVLENRGSSSADATCRGVTRELNPFEADYLVEDVFLIIRKGQSSDGTKGPRKSSGFADALSFGHLASTRSQQRAWLSQKQKPGSGQGLS